MGPSRAAPQGTCRSWPRKRRTAWCVSKRPAPVRVELLRGPRLENLSSNLRPLRLAALAPYTRGNVDRTSATITSRVPVPTGGGGLGQLSRRVPPRGECTLWCSADAPAPEASPVERARAQGGKLARRWQRASVGQRRRRQLARLKSRPLRPQDLRPCSTSTRICSRSTVRPWPTVRPPTSRSEITRANCFVPCCCVLRLLLSSLGGGPVLAADPVPGAAEPHKRCVGRAAARL